MGAARALSSPHPPPTACDSEFGCLSEHFMVRARRNRTKNTSIRTAARSGGGRREGRGGDMNSDMFLLGPRGHRIAPPKGKVEEHSLYTPLIAQMDDDSGVELWTRSSGFTISGAFFPSFISPTLLSQFYYSGFGRADGRRGAQVRFMANLQKCASIS